MTLAIFDLDETLLCGDSASLFCRFLADSGLADADFLVREQALMQRYACGSLSMPDYVAFLLQPLQRLSTAEIDALLPDFVSRYIEPRIYPQARTLLAELRAQGQLPLIISATPAFIVRAVAQALGVQELLAIELETSAGGYYSGAIAGIPSYREGKVIRLQQWLAERDEPLEGAAFYTDSINDLPLLERVDRPIATNPDPRLTQIANARGWPLLRWQAPTLPEAPLTQAATGAGLYRSSPHHPLETANTGREA